MNITGIQNLIGMLSGNKSHSMLLSPSSSLRADLQVGKVVSGSVESSLGNNKYLVRFAGEGHVVDSTTPLKTSEIIHGRVIGIGDKVELQRVFQEKASADKQSITQQNWQHLYEGGKAGLRSVDVLQSYRVSLSAEEQLSLINVIKSSGESDSVILSAVVLNKMGVTVNIPSLTALFPALSITLKERFNLQNITAHLDFEAGKGGVINPTTLAGISAYIASVVNELPETQIKNKMIADNNAVNSDTINNEFTSDFAGLSSNNKNKKQDSAEQFFDARRLLLNSQSDTAVSHRIAVVPFVINDKLIEVDVAFFSQRNQVNDSSIKYKKIVLSLNLDMIGKVDIEIALANKHARVNINTDKDIITDELVKYMPQLKSDLLSQMIKIDELSYETSVTDDLGNVISSVVDHYVTQDSLSRVY